jgi:diguanylate cyclase (GGDEF)-like protein
MRIGRHELLLTIGLAAALAVAFSGELSTALQAMRDFESHRRLGLLPGFTIAVVTFLVFLQGKRRELQRRAEEAAAEASEAHARAGRLGRLVTFWHALAESPDLDNIRGVLERHLPGVTGSAGVWAVARDGQEWTVILGPKLVPADEGDVAVTDLAREILSRQGPARPDEIVLRGQACFPMVAAGTWLGVLGLPAGSAGLTPERRLVVGAAVALVGVSLNSLRLVREVRDSSLRDALTGCANREHAMDQMVTELARARRTRHPVSLVMFDVDRFKSVNDRYGHLCGDTVLASIGALLRRTLRTSDVKCRYGGEEFLVVLPDTPVEGALRAAETLRRELKKIEVPWDGETVSVTGSFGVACGRPGELDPSALIARADEALYRAKREGRDLVRAEAGDPPPGGPAAIQGEPNR